MFCNKCGSVVPNGVKYCHKCGAKLPVLNYQRVNEVPPAPRQSGTTTSFVAQASEKTPKRRRVPAAIYIVAVAFVLIVSFVAVYYGTGAVVKNKARSVYYLEAYDEYNNFLGSGSGFLISGTDIATNYHVIEGAATIVAISADNTEEVSFTSVVAYDKDIDLAVLRGQSSLNAKPLKLANSDSVRQGDKIYAIGYPLGLSNTLSDGIVRAC